MTEKFLIFFIRCCYFTANIANIGVSRTFYLLINRNRSNYPTSISIKVKRYFISRREVFYGFFIRFNIKDFIFATFVLDHCYQVASNNLAGCRRPWINLIRLPHQVNSSLRDYLYQSLLPLFLLDQLIPEILLV